MEQVNRPSSLLKIYLLRSQETNEWSDIVKSLSTYTDFILVEDPPPQSNILQQQALISTLEVLPEADVYILLVSKAFLESVDVRNRLPAILEKGKNGEAFIVPFILEPCEWHREEFASYNAILNNKAFTIEKKDIEPFSGLIQRLDGITALKLNPEAYPRIVASKKDHAENLMLSDCGLSEVPEELMTMPWIKRLSLDRNRIKKVEYLDLLAELEVLNLARNEIVRIENLDNLPSLKVLDFEHNYIERIENLDHNPRLEMLGLSSNRIQKIEGVTHLKNLKTLFIGHNGLRDIQELESLPGLETILLSNNQITTIAPLLDHIRKGLPVYDRFGKGPEEKGIFVPYNSLLSEPPREYLSDGNDGILRYFEQSDKYGKRTLQILKLILVGNSGVGKSNLSQFLRKKKMARLHNSTHLLEIEEWYPDFLKTTSGESMRVNIFDFGGQDYYHDAHSLYYSHDTAYILMWDAESNRYSRQEEPIQKSKALSTKRPEDASSSIIYENYPLNYWLESIQYNLLRKESNEEEKSNIGEQTQPGPEEQLERRKKKKQELERSAPILILQNKIDKEEALLDQLSIFKEYGNVKAFFNIALGEKKRTRVLEEVLNQYLNRIDVKIAGRVLPVYEYKIVQYFLDNTANRGTNLEMLTMSEFHNACVRIINNPAVDFEIQHAHVIAKILNTIGIIFYDQVDAKNRSNGIIFRPVNLLNAYIKDIMAKAKAGNDKGIFSLADLTNVPYKNQILDLLIRNKSVIRVNEQTYLAPQFLPVDPDQGITLFIQAFTICQVRYVYPAYFPKSLLLSLFAKFVNFETASLPHDPGKPPYWRNGIILSKKVKGRTEMAFVQFVKESGDCQIQIRTMFEYGTGTLEREIEAELDILNDGWKSVKEVSANSIDFFDVEMLKDQASKRIFTFPGESTRFSINDFKKLVKISGLPKKLFISYSSKNSDFIKRFVTHLEVLKAGGLIEPWYDRMIESGAKWDDTIKKEMQVADVIIFLLSPDFLATEYIMKTEVPNAIAQAGISNTQLFFIEVQACSWEETPIWVFQQNLDPRAIGKTTLTLEKPENDKEWKEIVKLLKKVLV
jgi:internalin A